MAFLPYVPYLAVVIAIVGTGYVIFSAQGKTGFNRVAMGATLDQLGVDPADSDPRSRPRAYFTLFGVMAIIIGLVLVLSGFAPAFSGNDYMRNAFLSIVGACTLPAGFVIIYMRKNMWVIDGMKGLLMNSWNNKSQQVMYDDIVRYEAAQYRGNAQIMIYYRDRAAGAQRKLKINPKQSEVPNLVSNLIFREYAGQFYTDKDRQRTYEQRLSNAQFNASVLTKIFMMQIEPETQAELNASVPR